MPMGINSPLPASLRSECKKVGKILASFVDPRQAFGPDKVIPPSVLSNAKGLAVITVLKAGFLFSGRVGSGLVVARLPDGSWSAPSAVITAGMGFGGQIGAEVTDFVMILNDQSAVRAFSQLGNVTLGGNISIAAGPIGRNAEASGAANFKAVAPVFSYSKTKGLFAGVSLEGSVLVERRDANRKFYNAPVTARQLLTGQYPAPPGADPLYRVLNTRAFSGSDAPGDAMYNDIPVYGDEDESDWGDDPGPPGTRTRDRAASTGRAPNNRGGVESWRNNFSDEYDDFDEYDRQERSYNQNMGFSSDYSDNPQPRTTRSNTIGGGSESFGDYKPARPTAPKPVFTRKDSLGKDQYIAQFTFDGEQGGDLSFKKGDVVEVTKSTGSRNDWWTGRIGDKTGIFPANYLAEK